MMIVGLGTAKDARATPEREQIVVGAGMDEGVARIAPHHQMGIAAIDLPEAGFLPRPDLAVNTGGQWERYCAPIAPCRIAYDRSAVSDGFRERPCSLYDWVIGPFKHG